ncbi:hypothetical protein B0I35DRAFT_482946 [Stachybotrys elegans]|uniref:Uncharacterized protein n=1 Tax=Stachybotrys elegans TaxID=80388 RepID=A0A8K0SM30_9HYPO|nr:hypothetical protein B0I35DRAFT_482946 [Stachybotrys elegans]
MAQKLQLYPAILREVVRFVMRVTVPILPTAGILHIMTRTFQGKCANDRDVIYGALRLFPVSFRDKVTVDYSLSTRDVYANFLRCHVSHVGRLEMLRVCDLGTRRPDMPSWVPDFTRSSSLSIERGATWQVCAGYSACYVSSRAQALKASGVHAAVIQAAGKVVPDNRHESSSTFLDTVRPMRSLMDDFQETEAATKFGTGSRVSCGQSSTASCRIACLSFIGPLKGLGTEINESIIFGFGDVENAVVEDHGGFLGPWAFHYSSRRCYRLSAAFRLPGGAAENKQQRVVVGWGVLCPRAGRPASLSRPTSLSLESQFHMENIDGAGVYKYFDTKTGEDSDQDPHMGGLPDDMEVVPRDEFERTVDDPITFQCYRNKITGATMTSDPILTTDALIEAGVPIVEFTLV